MKMRLHNILCSYWLHRVTVGQTTGDGMNHADQLREWLVGYICVFVCVCHNELQSSILQFAMCMLNGDVPHSQLTQTHKHNHTHIYIVSRVKATDC